MEAKKISYSEAFKYGWETVKSHFGFVIAVMVIYALLAYVPSSIAKVYRNSAALIYLLTVIVASAVSIIVNMGLLKIFLDMYDGKKPKVGDLFSCHRLFFKYLFSSFLYNLIAAIGLILLIVPGVIWLIQFSFYGYFIVDKTAGPIQALKMSSSLTRGVKWRLFIFGLLFFLINVLGVLALLIGVFITVPVTMLATVFVYRKLLTAEETAQPTVAAA